MPHFPNPYDFVPLESGPDRSAKWRSQENAGQGLTGKITCELTVLTPLFVGAVQPESQGQQVQYVPVRYGDTPVLPASALKGMLRSVMEAASNSCLGVLSVSYKDVGKVTDSMAKGYRSCIRIGELCPVCALMGMTEETADGSQEKGNALAGRVLITDAQPVEGKLPTPTPVTLPARKDQRGKVVPIGSPKPSHKLFYFDTNGQLLGRKFYYRTAKWRETIQKNTGIFQKALKDDFRTIGLTAITPTSVFSFDIYFNNLSPSELDLLVYGLALEEGACHHLGYAKPFGLGSVQIEIKSIKYHATADGTTGPLRYLQFQPDEAKVWKEYDYTGYADRVWDREPQAPQTRQKLLHILQWPRQDIFLYPDRKGFFNETDQKWKSLAQYQSEAHWVQAKQSLPKSAVADDVIKFLKLDR